MKGKEFWALGGLGIAFLATWAMLGATGQQAKAGDPHLITVTGNAEVRVVPDEVLLTLGVETWDKSLEAAKRQNDQIVTRLLALAQEKGVSPEHVQIDYVQIEPRYKDGYYEARDFVGYFVHKTVAITLRDLTEFEPLLAGALEAGVNYVHGVEFRTTELRTHRDEARRLAVIAAREKAAALAQELGQKVGQPHTIQEEQSDWWSGYSAWWGSAWRGGMSQNVVQEMGGSAPSGAGSLAPGQIGVRASVTVSFELDR